MTPQTVHVAAAATGDQLFRDLFTRNPLPMWLFDPGSLQFLEVNEAAVRKYGWTRAEFLTMSIRDIRPPDEQDRLANHLRQSPDAPATSYRHSPGWRHALKDGTVVWVDIYSYDFDYGGRTVRLVMVHDVSELRQVAEGLHRQSAYFRQLFENSPEAVVMLDQEDKVVDANRAFQALFLYTLEELRGRLVNDVIVPEGHQREATALSLTARGAGAVQRDTVRRRKDGKLIEVSALGYPITIEGAQVGVFAIYRDVTESKRIASALAYHSTHDPLTGLINRHEFERRTRDFLHRATRSSRGHALLYLDLDQFKMVNDGSGHDAGDRLLVELADVIRQQLPETDAATLSRMGGDEFAAVLSGCSLEEAAATGQRVVEALRAHRFRWDDRQYAVSASVGVVAITRDSQSLTALLSAADAACFTAKEHGRGRVQVFSPDDRDVQRLRGELSWATRIMDALERDRFTLFFQRILPIGGEQAGQGEKFEVLVRMVDDRGQRVLPGLFIPAAERYGLMPAVDRRVVSRVLAQLQRRGPQGLDWVSVNLSGLSLGEEGFAAFIRDQLTRSGLPPRLICFEITETAAIANLSRALTFIHEMRGLGCSIALDDFGSGMSSFNYLKSLAVDYLKIDGSFIRDMPHNPLDCAMAEAIARIGRVKGIRTIAESVETEAALAKLRELDVDFVQGHLLHVPQPWDAADTPAELPHAGLPGGKLDSPLGI
ncbi:MAG TPA: EAL domain-containing protein [Candidatus Binatia bacterium]|nr:EAL domain-containing protein [Candidatus Binatia bacterium]